MATKSIINNSKVCVRCRTKYNLERHHCIGGVAYRSKAEQDGLWIYLCSDCHRAVHNEDSKRKQEYIRLAQMCYEDNHTREEWMSRYHKNFL